MVGLDRPVFGADGGTLDQGQEIALHALTGDVGADPLGARADLVDLIDEHDAVVLDALDRFLNDRVVVDQLVALFAHENVKGVAHGDAARLGALAERLAENVGQIDHADLAAGHAGNLEGGHGRHVGDLNFDLLVVELAGAELLAEGVARRERGVGAHQRVDHALLGVELGLGRDFLALGVADERNPRLEQIAHNLIDVAADITDLGELGSLDLDEGRARELSEAAGNLRLADAGRPDHEDVLGQNLLAHLFAQLLAAPAVAQGDRHRALGVALADDVAVELGDDLAGRKRGHLSLLNTRLSSC